MTFLDALVGGAVADTTVTVNSTLLPTPFTIPLSQGTTVQPGLLLRLLRPSVTVVTAGQTLVSYQPAGAASDGLPLWVLGLLLLGWLVLKLLT